VQYVWYGKGCEKIEREFALKAAQFVWDGQDVQEVEEGEENEEFWALLGGKGSYRNAPELQAAVREPRLFHCSNSSGVFTVEEVFNFSQDDLMMDDIFILDTYSTVYVWLGPESNEVEKKTSMETALEYTKVASEHDGRDPETPIIVTYSGFEPTMFTMWFQGWDPALAGKDAYEQALDSLKKELSQGSAPSVKATVEDGKIASVTRDIRDAMKDFQSAEGMTFPYSVLRRDLPGKPLPNGGRGIDSSKLEMYLADDEFLRLFKCKKEQWTTGFYKPWKQQEIKASLKLY